MGADLVFAVGACRSDSRDPLRSADSHVPPGQSFVRVDFSFEREFLIFFGEFKNSVINGIKISENENVLKVNKMELNEIIGTKKKMFDGDEWSSRGNCSIERAICRLMMLGAASSCVGALGRRASVGHFVAFRSGRRLTDRLPSS